MLNFSLNFSLTAQEKRLISLVLLFVALVAILNSQPGLKVIKLFSCSTQLSMQFFLLINVKKPTIVGILTLMSRKNSILGLSEPKMGQIS